MQEKVYSVNSIDYIIEIWYKISTSLQYQSMGEAVSHAHTHTQVQTFHESFQ